MFFYGLSDSVTIGAGSYFFIGYGSLPVTIVPYVSYKIVSQQGMLPEITVSTDISVSYDWYDVIICPEISLFAFYRINNLLNLSIGFEVSQILWEYMIDFEYMAFSVNLGNTFKLYKIHELEIALKYLGFNLDSYYFTTMDDIITSPLLLDSGILNLKLSYRIKI